MLTGFPLKDIEIFSKNFMKLRKINKINKKLDIFFLLIQDKLKLEKQMNF